MDRRPGRPASKSAGAAEAVERIQSYKKTFEIRDIDLSRLSGVQQSSVSRALRKKPPLRTPSLQKLSDYVEIHSSDVDVAALGESEIAAAAIGAWDRTPEGRRRLLRLLDLFREFEQPRRHD